LSTRRPASRVATPVPAENGSNHGERNSVVLGPRDRLVGELYIEGDLRVVGTVKGNLEATGDIEIAGSGKVNGDVTAYNRLTVGSDASLIAGDVRVARLTVEDGATFSGKVSMGKHQAKTSAPEPQPVPETQPQRVAETPPVLEPVAVQVAEPPAPQVVVTPPPKSRVSVSEALNPKVASAPQQKSKVAPAPPPKPIQQKGKRR
jgi:cytoskeletal protein CcmA (bactofilin family)